jgi:hypothetical protein
MTDRSDVARASVDVTLDAATAFEVFTAEIGQWYVVDEHTVVDHTRTKTMRIEPWVGGRFVDVHDLGSGEGIECGRVIVWDPPHRFVFVDERRLDVEVTFETIDIGCRVTVEERGLDRLTPDVARHVRMHGWHRYLPEWFHAHASRGDT